MTALPPRAAPGGFCNPKALPRGPRGFALCRRCGQECPGARRTFCSEACVHEWKVRTQPSYARRQVWKRDAGQCALCPAVIGQHGPWEMDHVVPVAEGGGSCGLENLRTLCRPCHRVVTAALKRRLAERKRQGAAHV